MPRPRSANVEPRRRQWLDVASLIVRIDAFYYGAIASWYELKRIRLTSKEREQFALQDGDILILDCSRVQPGYAICYLQSLQGLVELRKNAKHAINQSSINQKDVKSALFYLPPLPEQREIVQRVEALFTLADRIETRYQKAKAQVDRLSSSLLEKAFRGELVPTEAALARAEGRSYEPASALLERIRDARAAGGVATKSRRAARKRKE